MHWAACALVRSVGSVPLCCHRLVLPTSRCSSYTALFCFLRYRAWLDHGPPLLEFSWHSGLPESHVDHDPLPERSAEFDLLRALRWVDRTKDPPVVHEGGPAVHPLQILNYE